MRQTCFHSSKEDTITKQIILNSDDHSDETLTETRGGVDVWQSPAETSVGRWSEEVSLTLGRITVLALGTGVAAVDALCLWGLFFQLSHLGQWMWVRLLPAPRQVKLSWMTFTLLILSTSFLHPGFHLHLRSWFHSFWRCRGQTTSVGFYKLLLIKNTSMVLALCQALLWMLDKC